MKYHSITTAQYTSPTIYTHRRQSFSIDFNLHRTHLAIYYTRR